MLYDQDPAFMRSWILIYFLFYYLTFSISFFFDFIMCYFQSRFTDHKLATPGHANY